MFTSVTSVAASACKRPIADVRRGAPYDRNYTTAAMVRARRPTRVQYSHAIHDRAAPQAEGCKGEKSMPVYQIKSIKSGVVLGLYEAADEQGARDAMARSAGFDDAAQAAEVSGDAASQLHVSKV